MQELSIRGILHQEITLIAAVLHGKNYRRSNGYIDLFPLWMSFPEHGMLDLNYDEELRFGGDDEAIHLYF